MWRRHAVGVVAAALAGILALAAGCARRSDYGASPGQVQVEVVNVGLDNVTGAHYVLLKDLTGKHTLQILIGDEEARAIMLAMRGIKPDRPLTHDLLRDVIEQTGNHVDRVVISTLHHEVYYADVYLDRGSLRLDSRPSDAIALAMGTGAPIFVAKGLFEPASPLQHPASAGNDLPATISARNIVVQDLSPSLAKYFRVPARAGVLVVDASGLAARAGLMRGDIITVVDNHPVRSASDFMTALTGFSDPCVSLTVMRGGQIRTITLLRQNARRSGC